MISEALGPPLTRMSVMHRDGMTSTAPVVAHLEALVGLGMSDSMIARAAGVSQQNIRLLRAGGIATTRPAYAQAILGVDGRPSKHQALVLGVGARRRVQGLAVTGWRTADVAAALGVDRVRVHYLWRARQVTWKVHVAVRDVFERFGPDGGDDAVRTFAAGKGWVHPLLWDDIDDPFETPCEVADSGLPDPVAVERLVEGKPVEASPADREAAFHALVSQGVSMTTASVRVGFSHAKAKRLVAA